MDQAGQISLASSSFPATGSSDSWSGSVNLVAQNGQQLSVSAQDANGSCIARIEFPGSSEPTQNITVSAKNYQVIDIPSGVTRVSAFITNVDSTEGLFRVRLTEFTQS